MTEEVVGGKAPADANEREASFRTALAAEGRRRDSSLLRFLKLWVYPSLAVLGFLALWQLATSLFAIPRFLLPGPIEIVDEIVNRWSLLSRHGVVTSVEIVLGFVLAILIGVPLAVLISYSPTFSRTIAPLLVSSQAIPKVAIAPLFIVWFGFGLTPKLLITFLISFFPIVIDTVVGLQSTTREMRFLAKSIGASPWQTFWKIRLPAALPSIFGGLKVAITLAVVGAIVGEFVGASEGLGYVIQVANGQLNTRLLMAAIMLLSGIGVVLYFVVGLIERVALRAPRSDHRTRAG